MTKEIARDKLESLYNQGHTIKEISGILGVGYETVRKRFHSYGLEKRKPIQIPKEKLMELCPFYTDGKVGEMLGVCAEVVRQHRIKYGISPKKRRAFDPPKEVLEKLYQQMSMRDIASKFGVGETVVWSRLKEHNISLDGYESGGHRRKPGREFSKKHLSNLRKAAKARRGVYVGEKNPHWKGGLTGESQRKRSTGEYRDWKRLSLERAGFQCEKCGVEQESTCECCGTVIKLHVHHIKKVSEFPDLIHDPDNSLVLCPKCHFKEHY